MVTSTDSTLYNVAKYMYTDCCLFSFIQCYKPVYSTRSQHYCGSPSVNKSQNWLVFVLYVGNH